MSREPAKEEGGRRDVPTSQCASTDRFSDFGVILDLFSFNHSFK